MHSYSKPIPGISAMRSERFVALLHDYEGELGRAGYKPHVARLHLHSVAHFGLWLERRGFEIEKVDDDMVEGRPIQALLDTGNSGDLTVASDGGVEFEAAPVLVGMSFAVGGASASEFMAGRVSGTLRLGAVSWPAPRGSPGEEFVIGSGLLEGHRVTLDGPRARLGLDGPATMAQPSLRSAGFELEWTQEAWRVTSVLPEGGASSAGLQAGEQVLSLAGRAPGPDTLEELLKEGDELLVEVRRDPERVTLRVPVSTLVK